MSDTSYDPQATPGVMNYLNPLMAATMAVPPSPSMSGPNAGAAMGPSPAEIAAARLSTMGGGGGYRMQNTPEEQQQYQENVAGAAGMLPFASGARALYSAVAPTATAADDPFGAIKDDPALYQSWHNRFSTVKGVGKDANEKAQSRINQRNDILKEFGSFMGDRSNAQRQQAADTQAFGQWKQDNAPAIQGLSQNSQSLVNQASSLPEAQEMLKRGLKEREDSMKTVAEKYPQITAALEGGGLAASALIPGLNTMSRSLAMRTASNEAEGAYNAAFGAGSRASKGRVNAANLAASKLDQYKDMGRFESPTMLGLGTLAPYTLGTAAPNMYDIMMGSLSSEPGAKEKVDRAWANMTNPMAIGRAALEGGLMSGIGSWAGGAHPNFDVEKARANGILNHVNAANAEAATQAAAKSAMRKSKPKLKVVPNDD